MSHTTPRQTTSSHTAPSQTALSQNTSGPTTTGPHETVTPRIRSVARRAVFWIGAAIIALLVVVASAFLTRAASPTSIPLDGESSAPQGARAVLQVLRSQGVDVTVATNLDDASAALESSGGGSSAGEGGTLALYDPNGYLTGAQLDVLVNAADITVLIAPEFAALRELAPGVSAAGFTDENRLEADCELPVAERAEAISGGLGYGIASSSDADGCFASDDEGYGVIDLPDRGVTIVGPTEVFANETITDYGNAALALGLLGETSDLVWFLPTLDDVATADAPTVQELTPIWLVPSTTLLALTVLAAMYWRGRRFGPLVAEDLPVSVKAGETMQGRARLYQRTGARTRALDALRLGATRRLASLLKLPPHTPVWAVADAAAASIGLSPLDARRILFEEVPGSEKDLIVLADAVRDLEHRVTTAVTSNHTSR